jgi:hypothetical protein
MSMMMQSKYEKKCLQKSKKKEEKQRHKSSDKMREERETPISHQVEYKGSIIYSIFRFLLKYSIKEYYPKIR